MKKHISLFMVLFLSSCNVSVDIEPLKNKLQEISSYRENYVVNKLSYRSEIINSHSIDKVTYNVSFEDEYMYYKREMQTLIEFTPYRKTEYWIYSNEDNYVLVDGISDFSLDVTTIPKEDFTFIELIDDLTNKTPVYKHLKKYSSVLPYLFLDIDFLINLIDNDVDTFISNYNYVIDENLNRVEINRNNTTKYIYQNNILEYCEYSSEDEKNIDYQKYYISDTVNIVYP